MDSVCAVSGVWDTGDLLALVRAGEVVDVAAAMFSAVECKFFGLPPCADRSLGEYGYRLATAGDISAVVRAQLTNLRKWLDDTERLVALSTQKHGEAPAYAAHVKQIAEQAGRLEFIAAKTAARKQQA